MTTIWLALGNTDSHDDKKEWIARAFTSEAAARGWVDRANSWLHDRGAHYESAGDTFFQKADLREKPDFDPLFQYDRHTGAWYDVSSPVELESRW